MRRLEPSENILSQLYKGDHLAAGKLISLVENHPEKTQDVLREVYHRSGDTEVVGVTGPGGAGKSSLINRLIHFYRGQGKTVGVIAVDPSSPVTGGSLLGDRVRLSDHYKDPGVFIRSLASRGNWGGLARATCDVLRIIEAMGVDLIIIETLGVGQDELVIKQLVDTCLLVVTPDLGDEIQIFKAGGIEVADIIVINKSDQRGSEIIRTHLKSLLQATHVEETQWMPRLISTVSVAKGSGKVCGIDELGSAIEEHLDFIRNKNKEDGSARKTKRLIYELEVILRSKLLETILPRLLRIVSDGDYLNQIIKSDLDPYTAIDKILDEACLK